MLGMGADRLTESLNLTQHGFGGSNHARAFHDATAFLLPARLLKRLMKLACRFCPFKISSCIIRHFLSHPNSALETGNISGECMPGAA